MADTLRFDRFVLERTERRLTRDGEPVELNARYFDALALLASEPGRLVTKDRLLGEVWRGVPVTDEALTQCVKALRQRLGDDAARPRFIETVPKHGYRFIAMLDGASVVAAPRRGDALTLALVGIAGAGLAGFAGGLFYGLIAAAQPGTGAASVLLVLWSLCILVALLGGGGVAGGIALARRLADDPWRWAVVGGALGGLAVGAVVRMLGLDAFTLLLGRSPTGITGAFEGLVLGAATGLGGWLAGRAASLRIGTLHAALCGGIAGGLIPLLGGRLFAGSLALVAQTFPDSRLDLARLGVLFGEAGFGPVAQSVTGALEGALFAACVVASLREAERRLSRPSGSP